MMVLLIAVLVLVVGAVAAVVTGRLGTDAMAGPTGTSAFELPDGPLGPRGPDALRFDQALRGYDMGQVDAVLDRLFDEIATLRGQVDESSDAGSDGGSSPQVPDAPWKTARAADGTTADGTSAEGAATERVATPDAATAPEGVTTRRGRHAAADDDRS